MAQNEERLIFVDGFAFKKDFVIISSEPSDQVDYEFCRILSLNRGSWGHVDLENKVYSVCVVDGTPPTGYFLGRDGTVYVRKSGKMGKEILSDAGVRENKLGYVLKIREIAGQLYVCGASSQIYRRESHGWVHFDEGVLDKSGPPQAIALSDIDGTSSSDIYAVGEKGSVWHHDGMKWKKLPIPTDANLKAVRCVSPTEVFIVGYHGTVLKGSGEKWVELSNKKIENHFWDVEVYKDITYIAALEGLFALDGKKVLRVDTGITPSPDAYRLHANDGVLWSFGVDRLCFFDGKKWTYVKHPDNPD